MWNKVKVHPWVGSKYEQPAIFPCRTLILGESNYTSECNFHSNLVIECIEDHIGLNEDPKFSRFATKIRRVIFGRDSDSIISPKTFWENVAFYNFVQFLVGGASKERPTEKLWRDSVPAFTELVANLKPERILVLGQENWNNLLSNISHKKVSKYIATLNVIEHKLIAGYIVHPSHGRGFSYDEWQSVAREIVLKT